MIDPGNPDYSNTPVAGKRPHFGYAPVDVAATPAISIVTPFYNVGDVFHDTARSVLQQSLQQWEWIIVNDGSTDAGSLAILDTYRQRDERIRVIDHALNKGLPAARNTGYAAARSDFVLQLDGDDLLEPTAAEKWFWFLVSHPECAFTSGYVVAFDDSTDLRPKNFSRGPDFLQANFANVTAMIRRSVQQAVAGYDEALRYGAEDWEFWLRCASHGYWGEAVPEYLNWYRRRPRQRTRWQTLKTDADIEHFRATVLRPRYGHLGDAGAFPYVVAPTQAAYADVPDSLPCENRLQKSKPRLLIIARCLTMGGGAKFKLDLLEQFAGRGWKVTIATTDDDDNSWLPRFAAHTPDIFVLPNFLRLVDYPRFLRYLIGSRQPDALLLTGSELGYLLLPYFRAHFPQLPMLDFCHLENEERNSGGFPRLAVMQQDELDLLVVSSQHLKDWMVQHGGAAGKIAVQYTGIDAARWRPAADRPQTRQELAIPATCPVIICAARLVPSKQPRVAVRTAARLKALGLPSILLVAGDGAEMPWLRSFVAANHLQDCVRLLGALPGERVRQLLAASDIFFLPSANEGISLAIYEAMACGLAIVAAGVGGQRELVAPECGVLVAHRSEDDDVEQYSTVLASLLADPARGKAMGAASRARVEGGFRLEQMGDGMVACFAQAVERRRAAGDAALPLGLGRACAVQAVEYVRLSNEVAARQRAQVSGPANKRGGERLPARVLAWAITPGRRAAPLLKAVKRLVPLRLKVGLKRRLRRKSRTETA